MLLGRRVLELRVEFLLEGEASVGGSCTLANFRGERCEVWVDASEMERGNCFNVKWARRAKCLDSNICGEVALTPDSTRTLYRFPRV